MPDGRRVLAIGSLNLDRTLRVPALPAPGETIAARGLVRSPGGKGANQAVAAARAGGRVRMSGAVGADADGRAVLASLASAGVDAAGVRALADVSTGTATILVDDAAENVIVLDPGANGVHVEGDADALLGDAGDTDLVLLQGEIPAAANRAVAAAARARGARVAWSAAPAPASADDVVRDVDLLLVNAGELHAVARLLGADRPGDASREAAIDAVAERLGCDVVVTLGPDGAMAVGGGRRIRVPAPRVTAVDTTAAGDTFAGVLAAALQDGADLEAALHRAAAAAALAVTRPGAAESIPTAAEVDAFLAAG